MTTMSYLPGQTYILKRPASAELAALAAAHRDHGIPTTAEDVRLDEDAKRTKNWKRWGTYLSERQWGTVREDYSEKGDCWEYFPHDQAHCRAYRWGEDGILGLTDRECRICFSLALWNEKDPILKERLFGLTNAQGNHGEDPKELYYYLDATPTHSYAKGLYKYPQAEYPYRRLLEESARRDRNAPEFELEDSGVFDHNRYFDVFAEYAKASPNDTLIKISVANRGPETARLHLLPTIWFRNTWSWGCTHEGCEMKPRLWADGPGAIQLDHSTLGRFELNVSANPQTHTVPNLLFTENETNLQKLYNTPNKTPYVKDGMHERVIRGRHDAVNPLQRGTKAAAWYELEIPAGQEVVVKLRLRAKEDALTYAFDDFDTIFSQRLKDADEFHARHITKSSTPANCAAARQAYAGLIWSKQFYHYVVKDWLSGDPDQPAPPEARKKGRNKEWNHLFNRDVISMPDKWEYPWYAAWDLAFHMVPFCKVDPEFAKEQLVLFLREWYMHPNGQLPAYEFAFSDVNPPVHAWACWRVYKMSAPRGKRDVQFLKRVFSKLLINFTWWVNRKDVDGLNLFSGGFLGLDNIGVFDRSKPLPTGGQLAQADGTAWMAFYCTTMLAIAMELAKHDHTYEDVASKFFEHFVSISEAINTFGGTGLFDEQDGFYYDQLRLNGEANPLRIRSLVGLVPLLACDLIEDETRQTLKGFNKRMDWFMKHNPYLARLVQHDEDAHGHGHSLLAIPSRSRLERILKYLFCEKEFLSPYGIRSLSQIHRDKPFVFKNNGDEYRVDYVPGESNTWLFGGNSNWRGPIWMPMNYLIIEALERYHHFYGENFKVEYPTGSGVKMTLGDIANDLSKRLAGLFLPGGNGARPCHGTFQKYATDPHFKDLVLFHEYFHGDSGKGLGASHQTGWTALAALLLDRS